jgi:hypothetical protein
MSNTNSFQETFLELENDLDLEAKEWRVNKFYLDFDDDIEEFASSNRSSTDSSQQSSPVVPISVKKRKQTDDPRLFSNVPDYLSLDNRSFQSEFLLELCHTAANSIDFSDLQHLAFLHHQMTILTLHQQLWYRFLQSGTGYLTKLEHLAFPSSSSSLSRHIAGMTVSFWPKLVTSIMTSKGLININRQDPMDQDIYIHFVQNYLHQLETQINQRRAQINTIKHCLPYCLKRLMDKTDQFVQKEDNLVAMRIHFQTRIALLEYINIDRSYQWQYLQEKPTQLQVRVVYPIIIVFKTYSVIV